MNEYELTKTEAHCIKAGYKPQSQETCLNCGRVFTNYQRSKIGKIKFCSRPCVSKYTANHRTPETLRKMSESKSGEKAYQWKGDKAKYGAIHIWVAKHKGKPKKCDHCGTTKGRFEWANKDHKYRRVLADYIRLCVNCHAEYDVKKGFRKFEDNFHKKIN